MPFANPINYVQLSITMPTKTFTRATTRETN